MADLEALRHDYSRTSCPDCNVGLGYTLLRQGALCPARVSAALDEANEAAAEGIAALATLSAALDEANARAEAAETMVRRLEYVEGWCPRCGHPRHQDHAPGCELDALLRKR